MLNLINIFLDQPVLYYENFNLTTIETPVNVERLRNMLIDSNYDRDKTNFLISGFTDGFHLGYEGPIHRKDFSANLPFRGIGNKTVLWNKVMKEVQKKRYAGPFLKMPYDNFIQSPIGLVPKSGNRTRLIFHLSYDFKKFKSFNHFTPPEKCKVKYRDLDHAVRNCLRILQNSSDATIWLSIADLESAFRVIPGHPDQWRFLMMMAEDPRTGDKYYFADKCLPFGAGISCSLYSEFSNALAHILGFYTGSRFRITNYLDDFLFIETSQSGCNRMVRTFTEICAYLGVPVAMDKLVYATTSVKFLGVIINGVHKLLQVPQEKKSKALHMLQRMNDKRTATVRDIQQLTGLLNFLAKIIVPGRLFTRRMYAKMEAKTTNLMQHHHVTIDAEFRSDMAIWTMFLLNAEREPTFLCRPFIDLGMELDAVKLDLYTDSSANPRLGFGGVFSSRWFFGQWQPGFIRKNKPSIQYLELYAVCMAIFIWIDYFRNFRLVLYCDNETVCGMLNQTTSGCKHCMVLLRKLMVKCLESNTRVFAEHVRTADNGLSDSLSRLQFKRFLRLAADKHKIMEVLPHPLSEELWPLSKIWAQQY